MNVQAFIKSREPSWKQVESFLDRMDRGRPSFTPQELRAVGSRYRDVLSDLAYAQSYYADPQLLAYLNRLASRMYSTLYPRTPFTWRSVWVFFAEEFPARFRRTLGYTGVAAAWFLVAAVAGAMWTWQEPAAVELVRPYVERARAAEQEHQVWAQVPVQAQPYVSSFLMTNNITVMLFACFTGLAAGLGTLWFIGANGLMFGHIVAACHLQGVLSDLLLFVAAHGVPEFTAIFIAGGAGLVLGDAWWRPGSLPRLEVFKRQGREAVLLFLGALPIMVLAGIVESYFSPNAYPAVVKAGASLGLAGLLFVYLYLWRPASARSPVQKPLT